MVSHTSSFKDRLGARAADAKLELAPAASSSERDLQTLFRAHYASIWRLLRRLGVRHAQLDDAAQEVFWVAARRFADIEVGREHAFLYGVALRVAAQEWKKQRAAGELSDPSALPEPVTEAPSPEAELEQRQARKLLDSVLEAMSPDLRVVLVLFELEGLELTQIAAVQELPLGTVSSRLRRAREEFSAVAKRVRAALAAREGRRP